MVIKKIFIRNIFTIFNLVNLVLAGIICYTGAYKNMLFLIVAISNTCIGIIQESRAKRAVDKLKIITSPTAKLLREGKIISVPVSAIQSGDDVVLTAGDQIYADMKITEGLAEISEAQITGESELVSKTTGDEIFSGGFLAGGVIHAKIEKVGEECFAGRITGKAKALKTPKSEIKRDLNKFITVISAAIFPMGIVLLVNQICWQQNDINSSLISMVAALVGMIPEGLVLLSTIVMAVATIRLSKKHALVQEMYSIETLARVDTICLDKTGTLTTGKMQVEAFCDLSESDKSAKKILAIFADSIEDYSPTMSAIREFCEREISAIGVSEREKPTSVVPFNSSKKFSKAEFPELGTIVLGAPEIITQEQIPQAIREAQSLGKRVLAFTQNGRMLGYIIIKDIVRSTAGETIKYFNKEGVNVKIISGDNPETVSHIAREIGIENYDRSVDVSKLSEEELIEAADATVIFGRATPGQKEIIIQALQKKGHVVAMSGDGINDVPALTKADCGIAMATGTDAAKKSSQIVLVDSDFSVMPSIIAEGRRSINNLERSASLFLVKTIFSFILTAVFLILPRQYPFIPIQLTLLSALCIGAPSFVLALEPCHERIRKGFLKRVIKKALPGGLSVVAAVLGTVLLAPVFGATESMTTSISFILTAACMLVFLYRTAWPYNKLRLALCIAMTIAMIIAVVFFDNFFSLTF